MSCADSSAARTRLVEPSMRSVRDGSKMVVVSRMVAGTTVVLVPVMMDGSGIVTVVRMVAGATVGDTSGLVIETVVRIVAGVAVAFWTPLAVNAARLMVSVPVAPPAKAVYEISSTFRNASLPVFSKVPVVDAGIEILNPVSTALRRSENVEAVRLMLLAVTFAQMDVAIISTRVVIKAKASGSGNSKDPSPPSGACRRSSAFMLPNPLRGSDHPGVTDS